MSRKMCSYVLFERTVYSKSVQWDEMYLIPSDLLKASTPLLTRARTDAGTVPLFKLTNGHCTYYELFPQKLFNLVSFFAAIFGFIFTNTNISRNWGYRCSINHKNLFKYTKRFNAQFLVKIWWRNKVAILSTEPPNKLFPAYFSWLFKSITSLVSSREILLANSSLASIPGRG